MANDVPLKPFETALSELHLKAEGKAIKVEEIVKTLEGRGAPVFLIFLCVPFLLPISLPGLAIPFGIMIAIIGFRMAIRRGLYWPKFIFEKEISSHSLEKIIEAILKCLSYARKLIKPRWIYLSRNQSLHRMHGLFILFFGFLLALPLPLPLTNLTCSYPILFVSLGLLEDDGLFIIIGYIMGAMSLVFWTFLFIYSYHGLFNLGIFI